MRLLPNFPEFGQSVNPVFRYCGRMVEGLEAVHLHALENFHIKKRLAL